MARRGTGSGKMTRTSISLPGALKRQMDAAGVNWSAYLREVISQRIKQEGEECGRGCSLEREAPEKGSKRLGEWEGDPGVERQKAVVDASVCAKWFLDEDYS